MLDKLFKAPKFVAFSRRDRQKPPLSAATEQPDKTSPALKIVHIGGKVECYYMATPAVRILDKYPSFALAKPEVFRRPWDSVVCPEKILIPGQKFLLVPHHTVKKLCRKIKKPNKETSSMSFASRTSNDSSIYMDSRQHDDDDDASRSSLFPESAITVSGETRSSFRSAFRRKTAGVKKHVRFVGIDAKHRPAAADKNGKAEGSPSSSQAPREKSRARNPIAWQPSLTMISENRGD